MSKKGNALSSSGILHVVKKGNCESALQSSVIKSPHLTEAYLCVRPPVGIMDLKDQAYYIYNSLFDELDELGISAQNMITEKIFFSNIEAQMSSINSIRDRIYHDNNVTRQFRPAASFIQQPPARHGQFCEIQVYACEPSDAAQATIRNVKTLPDPVMGKIVVRGNQQHLYLANIIGRSTGRRESNVLFQLSTIFKQANSYLEREEFTFGNVVRTWLYLKDVDRDYRDLNFVRTKFYKGLKIYPYPASTGIQGIHHFSDSVCGIDLYAVKGNGNLEIYPLHCETMNEAENYGSSFSRGMVVKSDGRSLLYVSGTASIDTEGNVVSVRDITGQIKRMFINVESLLLRNGAKMQDIVTAITYLKRPAYLDPFLEITRTHHYLDRVPNTVCVADVCRPEWLCEIELIAAL